MVNSGQALYTPATEVVKFPKSHMNLEFSGAPEIPAPQAKVWERLLDPDFIAESAPGVESVEAVDATHFRVISGLGVGSVQVKFGLDVELADIVAPERLTMTARGKGPGSEVDVVSRVRLEDTGRGRTRLHWSATTRVHGLVASLGAPLVETIARGLTEKFWTDFALRVGRDDPRQRPVESAPDRQI